MQQEATKKNKKLIWLIVALVALLAVVGAVLAMFLLPGNEGSTEPTGPVGGRPELYWNVDRDQYLGDAESAGLSTREPGEDGLYHLRFAYNGELVEYTVADKRLVNVIDNQDVLGLVFDENGNVIDAINPNTIATEVAKDFVVQRIQSDSITLNSSIAMNGMEMSVKLCELTQIYDVRDGVEKPGDFGELELMDKLVVYANDKGETTHIYIIERQPTGIIGWRVDRKQFDTTTQHSTRQPDENGVWHITIAVDGKHVEYKCKDQAIVDDIDKRATYAADIAVRLDEEGYIVEVMEPSIALRGKLAGASYHITALDGNQFTATYEFSGKDTGKSFSGTITENTKIYNVCYGGTAAYIGEPTELQVTDRVIVYTDLEGNPLLIFVTYRMVDVPVGFTRVRMWDSTKQETTRVPNASGYYEIEMAVEGKLRKLRTKDKAIVDFIDSNSHQMAGLELDGDIIVKAYNPHYVCGADTYGAGGRRYIKDITGVIISWVTVGYDFESPTNLVARSDIKVYDVTGYPGTKFGAETELQVGDLVRPLVDYHDNITHLYVVARYTGTPLYYNLSRQYDDATASTKRVPDEEGYYVYKMASQGKEVTVKTKSKEMADFIDMQYAPVVSLKVDKNGIVKGAYPAEASYKFGYKTANWNWFEGYNEDGTIATTSYSRLTKYNLKLAKDVKIYNVSTIYDKNRGEQIKKLMPNDLIQAVAVNDTQEIQEIYVITRQVESKFYYNISRKYNTTTKETTRVPDAEGYYVFDLSVEGKTKQFKTKDKAIANTIDSYGYVPFGMQVKGDVITRAFSANSILGVASTACSNYDVTKLKGNDLTVTAMIPTASKPGDELTFKLASNYKAYNVSSYADPFGGKVKLALGDRIRAYTNMDGEVEWIWIWYKNTHQKGYKSYCEHCDKTVYWQPYSGATYTKDAHVYVTHNGQTVSQATISNDTVPVDERPELVIDLNGYTLNARTRAFIVYGTLSIVDTVGGGKIVGGANKTATTPTLQSSTNGVINLYSGTITRLAEGTAATNGGCVFVGADSTLNIYGGTIEGGFASGKGGNVYSAYGTVNMYGGKITGGVNGAGRNLYIGATAAFNMEGGVIDGDVVVDSKDAKVSVGGTAKINKGTATGMQLAGNVILSVDKVTADTQVVVDAAGVFTQELSNPEAYLKNFTSSDPDMPVVVAGKALAGGMLQYCEHCEKEVYFGKFSTGSCTGSTHLLVTEDLHMDSQIQIGTTSSSVDDVVIDLNGHTITTDGNGKGASTGRFALLYSTLSIMDSKGGGKIQSQQKGLNNGGVILIGSTGKLNLYSGELSLAEGASAHRRGGVVGIGAGEFNMYGGKVAGGRIADNTTDTSKYSQGGNLYLASGGRFNMYGGELVNGANGEDSVEYLLGGNIGGSTGSVINIYGGIIRDGSAEIGGNIYTGGKLNILGGEVLDGHAVTNVTTSLSADGKVTYSAANGVGGNLYVDSGASVVIGGEQVTKLSGGTAHVGGNIYIEDTKTPVLIDTNAIVENGKAESVYEGDEKYNGGNIYMLESTKVTVKGTVTGGHAWQGGNISANGLSEITVDGGTISDGTIDGWNGGNIQSNNGVVKLLGGATVTNGKANRYRGGNIYAGGGAEVYIADATVSGGSAWQGGNIFINGRAYKSGEETKYDYGILEISEGAVITGGTTLITDNQQGGGNICALGVKITVNDATIEKGVSKSCGGNIYASFLSEEYKDFVTTITLGKDAKVLGGEAQKTSGYNGGGNIYANSGTVVECAGTIADGKSARYGGNVMLSRADLILLDGAKVENGTATAVSGGNICKFNYGTVDIQAGATVSGGTAADGSGSIFISGDDGNGVLNIAGTVTGGQVLIYNKKVDVTVSGAAKVDYLKLNTGAKLNLGELTDGADIVVEADTVFTNPNEKAEDYKKYFRAFNEGMDIAVTDNNELALGVLKHCEHCQKEAMFTSFKTGTISSDIHMIVTKDTLLDAQLTIGSTANKDIEVVVDLNGHTVSGNPESASNYKRFALVYGKLFIQDSSAEQTGKVVGYPTTENAGTIMLASTGNLTLYSGEIAVAEGTAARKSAGTVSVGSGKFVMNGGKITGGNVTDHLSDLNYTANMGGAIYVTYGSFTMNGGEVVGGQTAADATLPLYGGAIYNTSGTVVINDGTVSGGKAARGGAIYTSGTLTVNGGTITGGEAVATVNGTTVTNGLGGNIYAAEGAKVTIGKADGEAKATVTGGKAYRGGNIYIADTKNTVTVNVNGVVENGEAVVPAKDLISYNGGNVYMGETTKLTVKGQIVGGKAYNGGNITNGGGSVVTVDGGTVSGGVIDGSNGGNIQSNNGKVSLKNNAEVLGGKAVNGGNIYAGGGSELYIDNSTVSGGEATYGGNIFASSRADAGQESGFDVGKVEITGKSVITGGKSTYATSATPNGGGNINLYGAELVISDSTVTGGNAKCAGGNISAIPFVSGEKTCLAKVTVNNGAKVESGTSVYFGGNIFAGSGCQVTVDGAAVTGGTAAVGGNIYVTGVSGTNAELVLSNNATVSGGTATTSGAGKGGGNIYTSLANVTAKDAVIENGTANTSGGNLCLNSSVVNLGKNVKVLGGKTKTATGTNGGGNIYTSGTTAMTVSGTVSGGQSARFGGNIMINSSGDVTLTNGAVVENGKSTTVGGEILKFGTGTLDIQAGAEVKGGTASGNGEKHGTAIYASAGSVKVAGKVGGYLTVDGSENASAKITLTGAPQINHLYLPDDARFDITLDNLTDGAAVKINTNGVFTLENDKVADYVKYFTSADPAKAVVRSGKTLYVGVLESCEHCDELVVWVPFDRSMIGGNAHMRLTEDVELDYQLTIGAHKASNGACTDSCNHTADVVIDLMGYDVTLAEPTATVNYTRFALVYGKLSIMDSSADSTGTITATAPLNGGVVLLGTNGKLDLYNGELKLADNASAQKSGGVVAVGGGVFNMYGGKLTGGKLVNSTGDYKQNLGGSVYVTSGGKFTMTGGTISGGKLGATGQKDLIGGNIYALSATVVIEGGTVTGGDGYVGGNVYAYGGSVTIGKNAVISDGTTPNSGANVYVEGPCKLTIDGATVTGGAATKNAGNICVTGGSTATIKNATVSDGTAVTGGNIYVSGGSTATIENTKISGGVASNGGNVYVTGKEAAYTTVDIIGGSIENGKSTGTTAYAGGGNIYATRSNVTVTGTKIENGEADQCGGNIYASHAELTLGNGTVLNGGKLTGAKAADKGYQLGSSICKFNSGKLDIQAGATVNGNTTGIAAVFMSDSSKSDSSNLTIAGTVVGTVDLSANTKSVTVSGDAKISKLNVPAAYKITLGELTENADITVSATGVFTNENSKAEAYKKYFHSAVKGRDIAVSNNALLVGNSVACAHCDGADAVWETFAPEAVADGAHLILKSDVTLKEQLVIEKDTEVVIDLNGFTVTTETGTNKGHDTGRFALVYGKLFLQDSSAEQDGKVVASQANNNGGAVMVASSGEMTMYGGELALAEGAAATKSGGVVSVGGGKFTLEGGKISGGKVKDAANLATKPYDFNMGGTVYVTSGSFTMNGGEVLGGIADESATLPLYGGAIYNGSGTVTINGGTVTGGTAANGGSIYTGGTLTINDGTVTNGMAVATVNADNTVTDGLGGSIYVASGAKVTIGKASSKTIASVSYGNAYRGGNIYVADTKNIVLIEKSGAVENGLTSAPVEGNTSYNGGNIYMIEGAKVTVKGLLSYGRAWNGGNVAVNGGATLTVNGGTVYNGTTEGYNGGNICSNNGIVYLTGNALVMKGESVGYRGGNIYSGGGAELYITEATVTGGKAQQGGNIYVGSRWTGSAMDVAKLEIGEKTTILKGEALTTANYLGGGNIYSEGAQIVMNGGVVKEGISGSCGGNIVLANFVKDSNISASSLTMDANASVLDGKTTKAAGYNGGGNIYAVGNAVLDVAGKISGGESARYGGNILASNNAQLILRDGAVVENGKGGPVGGNICTFEKASVDVQAGAVVTGGTTSANAKGTGTGIYTSKGAVNVAGQVDGYLTVEGGNPSKVSVTGAAQIEALVLPANYTIAMGELTDGAEINVYGTDIITDENDKAADYAKYFHSLEENKTITVVGKTLCMGAAAPCAHCGEGKSAVWVPFDAENASGNVHMIVKAPVTLTKQMLIKAGDDVVVDLNGQTVSTKLGTEEDQCGRFARVLGKLTVMDSSANTGKIVAEQKVSKGGVISIPAGGEVNLLSGELTLAEGSYAVDGGGIVLVAGGTFNMHDGKITGGKLMDGTGSSNYNQGACVSVESTGTFNMYGGEITGGKAAAADQKKLLGGNIYVSGGTVLIQKGTISAGEAYIAGNIYGWKSNITLGEGAVITGGKASTGGSIYVEGGSNLTVNGASISGGTATANGGNFYITDKSTVKFTNAAISGGTAVVGGNIYCAGGTTTAVENCTVSGGIASGNGGNISASGKSDNLVTLTVTGGTVENGESTSASAWAGGGNIYGTYCNVTVTGTTVSNGKANQCGGNIYVNNGDITLGNGAVLNGGTVTGPKNSSGSLLGSSVCKFNTGKLDIQAGATINGTVGGVATVWMDDSKKSDTSNLTIAGTINGEVSLGATTYTITVSGDAKITKLNVPATKPITLGELTANAKIGISATGVFTNDSDKAADYLAAGYFTAYDTTKKVDITGKTLTIVAK